MLLISDNLLIKYLHANDKLKLDEFINKKLFTVADTPLTYRQVNKLSEDKLLNEDRKNKAGWRKFSFKDLVYMLLVNELKKYGLEHEQLKELWECFFKERSKSNELEMRNKHLADIAIGCVFGQVEILMTVDNEGKIDIYDPTHYSLFSLRPKSHIQIVLNDIVNELLVKLGRKPFPVKWSIQQSVLDGEKHDLSTKEEELLKIIRNADYSAIRVKKKDGEIALVYAEKIRDDSNGTTTQDLVKMLNTKDFQDISIVKRDGKIVTYKVEEAIKL